jgi:hypothetical protein
MSNGLNINIQSSKCPSGPGSASSQEKLTFQELNSENKFELLPQNDPSKCTPVPHQDLFTNDSPKLEEYYSLKPSRLDSIEVKCGAVEPDVEEECLTEKEIADWEGQYNDHEIVDEIKRTIGGLPISLLAWDLAPSMFENDNFKNMLELVLETLKLLQ